METKKEKHKSVDRLFLSLSLPLSLAHSSGLYNKFPVQSYSTEVDQEEEVPMSLSPQWPTSALAGGGLIVTAI